MSGTSNVNRAVPQTTPPSRERYLRLLGAALCLLRSEPELRRSCLYQAAVFAGFSAAWTSIALLVTGPRYGLGAPAVGLIALVAAGSMFCTPIAGRAIDRRGPDVVSTVCILGVAASAAILLAGGDGGTAGMVAFGNGGPPGVQTLDLVSRCRDRCRSSARRSLGWPY
jgi:hypothetical protein